MLRLTSFLFRLFGLLNLLAAIVTTLLLIGTYFFKQQMPVMIAYDSLSELRDYLGQHFDGVRLFLLSGDADPIINGFMGALLASATINMIAGLTWATFNRALIAYSSDRNSAKKVPTYLHRTSILIVVNLFLYATMSFAVLHPYFGDAMRAMILLLPPKVMETLGNGTVESIHTIMWSEFTTGIFSLITLSSLPALLLVFTNPILARQITKNLELTERADLLQSELNQVV